MSAAVKPLPVLTCYSCGEPMEEGQGRGDFRGTEMHQLCAIELRLDNLEDALGIDNDTVDPVNRMELH